MNCLVLVLACALGAAEVDQGAGAVRVRTADATAGPTAHSRDDGAARREPLDSRIPAAQPGRKHTSLESILEEPPTYTGEPIDLDLAEAPIEHVIRLLAEIGGFSYVLDPNVDGSVTIHLKAVPWDQALTLILRSHGLGLDVEGNTLLIVTAEGLAIERQHFPTVTLDLLTE